MTRPTLNMVQGLTTTIRTLYTQAYEKQAQHHAVTLVSWGPAHLTIANVLHFSWRTQQQIYQRSPSLSRIVQLAVRRQSASTCWMSADRVVSRLTGTNPKWPEKYIYHKK